MIFSGPSGSTFRGMASLALGAIAARTVSVAAVPVLTRLYSPEDFGTLSVFTSTVLLLAPMATLRYAIAVPLPRRDEIAMNVMALSAALILVVTLLLGGLFWAVEDRVTALLPIGLIPSWWPLVIPGMLGTSAYELMTMWATRRRAYKSISKTQLTQSVMGEGVKVILGLIGLKPLGLILGQIVGQSGGIIRLYHRSRDDFRTNIPAVSLQRMLAVAGRYRGFPTFRLASQLLLVFSMQAPVLFAAALFGAEEAGQLGLAMMTIGLTFTLLGQSMSRAFYGEAASIGAKRPKQIRELTQAITVRMVILSAPLAIILFLAAPSLFTLAFGDKWHLAGLITSHLAVFLVLQFATSPLLEVFNIFGNQTIYLLLYAQRALLTCGIFLFGYWQNVDFLRTTEFYAYGLTLHYLLAFVYMRTYIRRRETKA